MSVNVSSREFAQPDLASEIRKALQQTGVDPGSLQLEIIETIAMGDAEKSGHVLAPDSSGHLENRPCLHF
jgi:EAL domain-containing protein (putative c-di-GMP-specific phosphodiesterase class I)